MERTPPSIQYSDNLSNTGDNPSQTVDLYTRMDACISREPTPTPIGTPLAWALQYASFGWHVFPLYPPVFGPDGTAQCPCRKQTCNTVGKHPIVNWATSDPATTDRTRITKWWTDWPDANIGIATGPSNLVVIDIDGPVGEANYRKMCEDNGGLIDTAIAKSGRLEVGWHLYFKAPEGIEISGSKTHLAEKIDVRAVGNMIVAPPSLHKSGQRYEWVNQAAVAELPDWLLKTLLAAGGGKKSKPWGDTYESQIEYLRTFEEDCRHDTVRDIAMDRAVLDRRESKRECEAAKDACFEAFWPAIQANPYTSKDKNEREVRDAIEWAYNQIWADPIDRFLPGSQVFVAQAEKILEGAYKKIRKAEEHAVNNVITHEAFKIGQVIHLLGEDRCRDRLLKACITSNAILPSEAAESAVNEGLQAGAKHPKFSRVGWKRNLTLSENGTAKHCAANVNAAFEHLDLDGKLAFDRRFQKVVLTDQPPWDTRASKYPRDWSSYDDVRSLSWLSTLDPQIVGTKGWANDAAAALAHENEFEPFRDYLDGLTWDGTDRLERVLIDICRAEDTILNRAFFKRWLISAVARTYEPGCKADYMLVLTSNQGLKKSTFFGLLLPDSKYYREGLPKGSDKDTQIALQGPVIIEDGEMSHYGAREVSAVKAFITCRDDKFRAPYDKTTESHPRRVVLCGSCNEQDFLHDDTGGRRFWPVALDKEIRLDLLTAEYRDQLWAEACHRYRTGEQWYLTDEEESLAKEIQEAHREIDSIEEGLQAVLRKTCQPGYGTIWGLVDGQLENGYIRWITVTQAIKMLDMRTDNKNAQFRVPKALRALGWTCKGRQRCQGLGQVRVYRAPDGWSYE